jgi:hypothetical protein
VLRLTIHSPNTSDDIHREDNSTKDCQLAQDIGRLLLPFIHANVDLGKVIAMRARKKTVLYFVSAVPWSQFAAHLLFVMRQVGRHCDNMILNIAQVQTDLATWSHIPLFVASFRESLDDVGFVAQQAV